MAARTLTGRTATLLVVASMVGTGIFTTSGFLLRDLGSARAVLASWAVSGLVALAGALSYAEVVSSLPRSGGEYALLAKLYHPGVGFAAGVVTLVAGFAAPVAGAAMAFATYAHELFPWLPKLPAAVALVLATSAAHAVHLERGARVQDLVTAVKLVLTALLAVAGLVALAALPHASALTEGARPLGAVLLSPAFAASLVLVSYGYSGWNAAAYVAGELHDAERSAPRALFRGTAVVTALYLALTFALLGAAPSAPLAAAGEGVSAVAFRALFGARAGAVLDAVIALGLVSTAGAYAMTGPRVAAAMGEDVPGLALLARRTRHGAPWAAATLQASLSLALVLTARFDDLLRAVGFALSLCAMLAAGGVLVLRARGVRAPFRTPLGVATPIAFVVATGWSLVSAVRETPRAALWGGALVFASAVAWAVLRPRVRTSP